jgi:phosphatidylinositol alpha-1,6-mannosyltransferase
MTAARPRVLVATPDFPPARGGIQTLLHEVVTRLQRVEPRVVTFAAPGWRAFDGSGAIRTARSPNVPAVPRASVAALNARVVATGLAWRPDAVLSGHAVMVPATSVLRAALGTPVVQYAHANEFDTRPGLSARAVRDAAATVAVSRYTRTLAIGAGAAPDRVHVIHPGVALPGPGGEPRAARPTLLTVARLEEPIKGHDVVLAALPRIRARVPDVEWVVIGDGPRRNALEQQAAALGVDDAVRFLGAVSDAERDRWLDRAHVFVLPSRPRPSGSGGEGFGIVFLEAAAHGLPVVAGAVGGALDAVADGETGLLVDPADAAAVAGAVVSLLLDPALARRLGDAGAARARMFSWAAAAQRVEDLLLATGARA